MNFLKCFLAVAAFASVLGGISHGQVEANRLCMHNGAEYYVDFIDHSSINNGCGKFFPSFAHWAGQGVPDGAGGWTWPWKIRGWCWQGMQGMNYGPTWVWASLLQASVDPPMPQPVPRTFKEAIEYLQGLVPHSGPPWPLLQGTVPFLASGFFGNGKEILYPTSYNGFDAYLNIFAFAEQSWIIPCTMPLYGWQFGYISAPSAQIHLGSNTSIYEYIWENAGPFYQYQALSGNELDCTLLGGGNKGRNYSVGNLGDSPYFYYFDNACTGGTHEWGMCLLVEDAVCIPVNVPGVPGLANPFAYDGFDVGTATVTPLASSGSCFLRVMTEDYANPGTGRALLAGWRYSGPSVPFGPAGYRIPHAWDFVSSFFSALWNVWFHTLSSDYPACMMGLTTGGHSIPLPLPSDSGLIGMEIRFSTFSSSGKAPSASFLVTYF
ncbi:MAG: hypothetical protein ACYTG7_22950 [Planctomycetota bacterium]